jgi:SAM-dependent methyltransferase
MASYIPEPVPIDPAAMKRIAAKLTKIKFDEKHCGDRLGRIESLPDFDGQHVPRPYLGPASDPLDVIISLFLLNEKVPLEKAHEVFTGAELEALCAMSLIQRNGSAVNAQLNLLPCSGNFITSDRFSFPEDDHPPINRVMWLYHESYILAGLVDRTVKSRATLDLGTGSGIHTLLASRHSDQAVGVDINPRAIAFARFNQRLNERDNVEFLHGDLYGPVADRQFDLILSNPPFNPTPVVPAGTDYWSGGPSGEEILSRICAGLDNQLTDDGICHIITLVCHHKAGPGYREKLDMWLMGGIGRYDVMAQVMDIGRYFDIVDSEERRSFLRQNFSRFEFGVISIRKSGRKPGRYYHGLPRVAQPLFDENGRFARCINHQTFDECLEEVAC